MVKAGAVNGDRLSAHITIKSRCCNRKILAARKIHTSRAFAYVSYRCFFKKTQATYLQIFLTFF